jgi:hypothetical protein
MAGMTPMGRAKVVARRAWPLAVELWRRWERLPEKEKERYRKMARQSAERGRGAYRSARERGGGRRGRGSQRRR